MDSLRTLVSNPALYSKIDTIDMLIEQKRWNTRRLLETWRETNAEHLYTQNIEGDRPARYDDPAGRNTGARDRAPGFRENSSAP